MKSAIALALLIAGAALSPITIADEKRPPPGAMALSTVLTKLEQQGYTPIVEVSLENGQWEIEAFKEGEPVKLKVDPNTSDILSEQPDES
ncbi:PepSY domain-containing protein [Microbulbifer flavimaris]|uniref:PepSY domain-containing protein n=1 Tax=Microbulbifer flavimaris TaxID=1781068 RepID=A0ABX4HWV2_9GAMM|nr:MULTISPECIES: PepSY domain-containing protein [Microbulbifer]KUJ81590.1 hypothetical protein AVO43_13665 [Microbulbifer sp. ZGT114]PCO04496.1 PepSY domain-containing protein [Microbulbifer flavimaris]